MIVASSPWRRSRRALAIAAAVAAGLAFLMPSGLVHGHAMAATPEMHAGA